MDRGKRTVVGADRALRDITDALDISVNVYLNLLDKDPPEVARRLRAVAAERKGMKA